MAPAAGWLGGRHLVKRTMDRTGHYEAAGVDETGLEKNWWATRLGTGGGADPDRGHRFSLEMGDECDNCSTAL
jgi:hypothetical protein